MTETGIEREFRDVTGGELYTGTSDIQRVVNYLAAGFVKVYDDLLIASRVRQVSRKVSL